MPVFTLEILMGISLENYGLDYYTAVNQCVHTRDQIDMCLVKFLHTKMIQICCSKASFTLKNLIRTNLVRSGYVPD